MQTETTNAPFLPMGQQGEQGYEAHFELSETLESTQFHCHDYYEFYIHLHGGESMGVENRLFPLKPNQVFVLLPFSMHGLSCTQTMHNYERGYLNLSPEVLRKLSCGQIDLDQFFRSHASGGVCTYQLNDADAIGTVYTVDASLTLNDYMCTTTLNEVFEDGMDVEEALQEAQDYLDMELD